VNALGASAANIAPRFSFQLEKRHLSTIHLNSIARIYGDHGELPLPVVLRVWFRFCLCLVWPLPRTVSRWNCSCLCAAYTILKCWVWLVSVASAAVL
jgi:hypothetical protein